VQFLQPLYLLGLLAVALPVLLHLLQRRRPRRQRFAALEFVLRSQRRVSSRFRLRQLLLLLARCLAVALLVLALARPQWMAPASPLAGSGPPTATVLVLDDSLSMRLEDGGESLFERARSLATEVLQGLRPEDAAAVVLASSPPRALQGQPIYERGPLLDSVAALQPSHRGTDLAGAVTLAASLLERSSLPRRRVLVLSDLRAPGFDRARLPCGAERPCGFELGALPIGPLEPSGDRYLERLEIDPAPGEGPMAYALRARVLGQGAAAEGELQLHLEIDGERVASASLQLQAGSGEKTFVHRFDAPGRHQGAVVLEPDALPADDRRSFVIDVQPTVQVLLVNGDPRPTPREDELYYLERALAPGAEGSGRLQATLISPPLLPGAQLERFKVVVLANVSGLGADQVRRLEAYAREGGAVLLSAGENVDPERWSRDLAPLLPRALRGTHRASLQGDEGELLAPLRGDSPLLGPLLGPGGEGLRAARFRNYLLLEPGGADAVTVHLSAASGAPLLLERQVGQGRVALFTSTLDGDWTDLPLRTGFLPLLQELLLHLADALRRGQDPPALVGARVHFALPSGAERVLLEQPGEALRNLVVAELPDPTRLELARAERPGICAARSFASDGRLLAEELRAVVTDPTESDLSPLAAADRAALGADGQPSGGAAEGQLRPERLWPWALALLLLMLLAEAVLLLRGAPRAALQAKGRDAGGS